MFSGLTSLKINVRQTLGFVILVLIWGWAAEELGPARLPSPQRIGQRFFSILTQSPEIMALGGGSKGMGAHLLASVFRVFTGGLAGISLGVGVGLLMGWSRRIGGLLEAPIEIFRAIPPLAMAPFLLIWFGPTATTQFVMLVAYTFLILVINTVEAIRNIPPVQIQYAQTLGATSAQVYRTVVLPSIVPELVGGVRVAIAVSWGIAVVTELLGSSSGIGKVFSMMLSVQGLDIILIGIIYVTLIALLTDLLWVHCSNLVTCWVPKR